MTGDEVEIRIDFKRMPKHIGELVANGMRIYSYEDVPQVLEWMDEQLPANCENITVLVVGRMPNYITAAVTHFLTQRVGRFFLAAPNTPMYEVFDVRCPEVY